MSNFLNPKLGRIVSGHLGKLLFSVYALVFSCGRGDRGAEEGSAGIAGAAHGGQSSLSTGGLGGEKPSDPPPSSAGGGGADAMEAGAGGRAPLEGGGGAQLAAGDAGAAQVQGGASGEANAKGGATSNGGVGGSDSGGGTTAEGGSNSGGGTTATGGSNSGGGTTAEGGSNSGGGTTAKGGSNSSGGTTATGGSNAGGGALTSGGTKATGGATVTGGTQTGGGKGTGGSAGAGGAQITAGPSVLTRSYDRQRTGSNLAETVLSPAVFRDHAFGKLFCKPVDDEIYGQILYLGGLNLGALGKHNVVFVATMNDSVYAFDADSPDPTPLWHVNYTDPANGITAVPTADLGGGWCPAYKDISHQVGITSTPVIDPTTFTLYFVARTKEGTKYVPRLHAIDVRTGDERPGSPVVIQASVSGTGGGAQSGVVSLESRLNNQRMGLLLLDGSIYIGFGSHCDTGPYHGWLLRYAADTLAQTGVFNTTPTGSYGGIWMSGAAPAVDNDGNLYLTTGNGTSDMVSSGNNYAQAFLKLHPSPVGIDVADWFTPANHESTSNADLDIGSSGPILIPNSSLLLGGGKEGVLYLLDRTQLGHIESGDSQIFQELLVAGVQPGKSHIHGAPVYWQSSQGQFVYIMTEEDYLRQFRLENQRLSLEHISDIRAPIEQVTASGTTMPGGILSVSASGSQNGLVWVNIPYRGDANQAVVPGVLRVFDAEDVTLELWNSELSARDSFGNFAKFNPPTVTGGKAYVATFSGQFCAYGVLPN